MAIDAHGFEILSLLRGYFPQTQSFLMDTRTFQAFKKYAVKEAEYYRTSLPHLTKNRLEQEKISHAFVLEKMCET